MDDLTRRIAYLSPEKRALLKKRMRKNELFMRSSGSPIVVLQQGQGRTPFFCVHASGGTVLCYADLAQLTGLDQPFYGIQSASLNESATRQTSVEEMAAHYISAMRDVQPDGPYLLGGWSMGAIVAYEMARQLVEQGREVALLALLDMWVITEAEKVEVDEALILVSIFGPYLHISLESLRNLDPDEQLAYVLHLARKENLVGSEVGPEQARLILDTFITNDRAAGRYVPKPYTGRVTLLRATEPRQYGNNYHNWDADPTLGWSDLAAGGVEVLPVPGSHDNIIIRPYVEAVARQLRDCIDKAQCACDKK
jgi:thioesterase domain-containing protein